MTCMAFEVVDDYKNPDFPLVVGFLVTPFKKDSWLPCLNQQMLIQRMEKGPHFDPSRRKQYFIVRHRK